nr:MAG: putative capsid protein [Arizlama virus]
MKFKKFYKKRGGFISRVPWIKRKPRMVPWEPPVPMQVPIRRPGPMQLPIPVIPSQGRKTNIVTETETKPEPKPKPKTKPMARVLKKRRGFTPLVRTIRRYLPTLKRPTFGRKRNAASMVKVKPMGQGTTFSKYKERRRKSFKRAVMRLAPLQSQLYTRGHRVTNNYSEQGTVTIKMLDYFDMLSIVNNIPSYSDATKFFMESGSHELFISNQALTNCYIRLYHFVYRRDTVKNPAALLTSGLQDIYTGTAPTVNTYGITPTQSPAFNAFIKIKRVYFIELGAGRTHLHRANYQFNKEWNNEILAEGSSSSDDMSYGGWTKGIFLLMHGEPVNDITTKTKVVPSSGAIDIVQRERINYRYADPTVPMIEYSSALDLSGITENVMDPATGAVEAQQIA